MRYDPEKYHRRSIRLKGYDYTSPGGYFITLVTQGRMCVFGEILKSEMRYSEKGQIAYECWRAIPEHFPNTELGAFAIMPNHVHGIIILHAPSTGTIYRAPTEQFQKPVIGSIPTIIRTYKAAMTRKIVQQFGGTIYRAPTDLWQRNYYEHIIRNDEEHKRIYLYIESNPLHWITDDENPETTP